MLKWISSGLLIIVFLGGLVFGLTWLGIEWYGFFEPKRENVRREVFESTRSYNQAKAQELAKYRLEYIRSNDPQEKAAIASTIRLRFADFDRSKLPHELQNFLKEVNQ